MPRRVEIRHPGYPFPNGLFSIPANDGPNRDRAHYPTILAIGAIFTETQSGLWLSKGSPDEPPIDPDTNDLIPAGEYFLHVTGGDAPEMGPYPITANFRAWTFPTQISLPLWHNMIEKMSDSQSTMAPELLKNDPCRITNNHLACENAHIIPSSEKAWFTRNGMGDYGQLAGRSGAAVADSASNLVRLTRDAHWLWDTFHFSVVPRADPETDGAVEWYTQMLVEDEELYTRWHHRKVQMNGRAPQYLFARFAWDVFPKLHAFLQAGQPRRLSIRQPDGKVNVQMYSAKDCWNFTLGQGRGRSASPTKRSRSDVENLDEDAAFDTEDCWPCSNTDGFDSAVADLGNGSSIDHWRRRIDSEDRVSEAFADRKSCSYWELDREEQEEDRGRKRQRSMRP